jgi:hypothetical protein
MKLQYTLSNINLIYLYQGLEQAMPFVRQLPDFYCVWLDSILGHSTWDFLWRDYFSFPCQYYSTIAPYSFIHLPLTLYSVSVPVLQFPLSVSFHQCSILIHTSTTNAVYCFSPSTSISPVSIIPPMLHTHSSTYMLLFPGQTADGWAPSNRSDLFHIQRSIACWSTVTLFSLKS